MKKANIDYILDEARYSTSKYCMEVCRAICCRRGFLPLTSNEAEIIIPNKDELIKKKVLRASNDGKFILSLSVFGCPQLDKENKCRIWKNPNRPQCCGEFPVFERKEGILFSKRCNAVVMGLLDKYKDKLKSLGYNIIDE